MRVLVVGGGIYGVTAALELRARGHDVLLVDQGGIPNPLAASTDVSKVVRMDYGADDFYFDLGEASILGWREWNAQWEETVFHEDGFLLLSGPPDPMAPGSFEYESWDRLRGKKIPVDRVDPDVLRWRWPAWNAERWPAGYFNPVAGWAESGRAVELLSAQAKAAGVVVAEGVRVAKLDVSASRATGVVTDAGERIPADVVVVAAGTWSWTLVPGLDRRMVSVGQPVWHLKVDDATRWRPPRFVPWAADISRTGWYGFPALDDGRLKIANHGPGRRLHPDDVREIHPDEEARLRAFLAENLPEIAQAMVVFRRLCLYADTFDGDFFVDRHPDVRGLVVSTGGSGHGFKFAPMLGAITADAVEEKDDRWRARFRWRDPGPKHTEAARFSG